MDVSTPSLEHPSNFGACKIVLFFIKVFSIPPAKIFALSYLCRADTRMWAAPRNWVPT